jgi:predicted GNAT family acetyltransferase
VRDEAEHQGGSEAGALGARRRRDAAGLRVLRPLDAQAFLDVVAPLLLTDEPRNNLILGITGTLLEHPDRFGEKHFWVVTDHAGVPLAAAMRTPPYNLLLAGSRAGSGLAELVDGIDDELPGVVGAHPEVDEFVRLWTRTHTVEPRVLRSQGVYALERVQSVPPAPGRSRSATRDDLPLLLDWMVAFGEEVLEEDDPGRAEAREGIEHRLASVNGGIDLWEDEGEVVSLSGWGGPTPNGIRIGPVYTPPERRGRGYATALVAEQSQARLDAGRRFCFLYTDLANPTSNAIYERIGYVKVAESAMVAFGRL